MPLGDAPPEATGPGRASAEKTSAEEKARRPVKAGGFSALESSDEGVRAAAQRVLEELQKKPEYKGAELAAITKAEGQVVAGYNYRLVLFINNGGANKEVRARVFRPLSGPMEVSSMSEK